MARVNPDFGVVGRSTVTANDVFVSKELRNSSWVKTGILATIAGYRFEDDVSVSGFAPIRRGQIGRLNRFLSFLLNQPRYHSYRFNVNVDFSAGADTATSWNSLAGTVVLASGGIDSTAALMFALDNSVRPIACWVNYGQPYSSAEYEAVRRVTTLLNVPLKTFAVDLSQFIARGERIWKHIFPARNFLLSCIALRLLRASSSVGPPQIWLNAQREDLETPDKSPRFFRESSVFLRARVTSPFLSYNKTEILAHWSRNWGHKYGILPSDTVTCYAEGGRCGRCKACLKRAIALVASGSTIDGDLAEDPFCDRTRLLRDYYLQRIDELTEVRRADLLIALDRRRDALPGAVCADLDRWLDQHRETCSRRRDQLAEITIAGTRAD